MVPLYKYYQLVGGEEQWTPCKMQDDLSALKPTFETVLALDTLLESDPDAETRNKIRYLGPLYFDIDSDSPADSIESAQSLLAKLLAAGLTEHDIEIYASGKKGFHLLVPTVCFMEKPDEPVTRLPAIYKEMAFKLAVPFLDFKVYTARRGRMLRTIYNQRENGLYKVAITADQLRSMTVEGYAEVASQPTGKAVIRPCFNARFSLTYTAACQRVAAAKPKRAKPPTAEVLRRDLQVINKLLRGECTQGFNKIALQLAIYAREVGWTEEQLTKSAQVLIETHQSDGYRYNTPSKRAAELRRMVHYVDDNTGYSYSSTVLRNMVAMPAPIEAPAEDEGAADSGVSPDERASEPSAVPAAQDTTTAEQPNMADAEFQAVRVSLDGMYADDGESVRQVSNASIGNLSVAHIANGEVDAMQADIYVNGKLVQREATLATDVFTGSASLHRELIRFGSGFWGTDMQARSVLGALHKAGAPSVTSLGHAGLDLVKLPNSPHKALRDGVLVWTGVGGAKSQEWARDLAKFIFTAEDSHQGVSDLMMAPHPADYFTSEEAVERLVKVWRALWSSNNEQTLGLLYGWTTACFYRPLIHAATQQFPLLHVAGAAGYGKTANVRLATAMHTYRNELPETTPNSTPFALSQLLSGYAATPILLDEYKPHRMTESKLEGFRSLFRDLYNGKSALRGGGGNSRSAGQNWKALGTTQMRAPLIFVAEALETETAIMERCVPVTVTKARGRVRSYEAFSFVQANRDVLSILGRGMVESILMTETPEAVGKALAELSREVGEELRTPLPTDTLDVSRARRNINERPLHNTSVVLFGLRKLWAAVRSILGDLRMAEFDPVYERTVAAIKDSLLEASATATPEMIKWVMDLNDMLRSQIGRLDLSPGASLVTRDGEAYLMISIRSSYSDYRAWCRQRGMPLYYANAESVGHALRHFDGYDANLSNSDTAVLEWSALQEAGMTTWYTKPVAWKY